MAPALKRLLDDIRREFAFCGVGVVQNEKAQFYTTTAQGITASEDSFWRAASISKIVTGRVAHDVLGAAGNETVETILGVPFKTPCGTAPTIAHLASHQSGITDAGGYVINHDDALSDWLRRNNAVMWSGAAAGAQFEYSNLGFIILAACAERIAGTDFGRLAQDMVLRPNGVHGGFNWAQAPTSAHILPTYRRAPDGQFLVQIDDSQSPQTPVLPADYKAGTRPHLFSPQGGLRLSLRSALRLAQILPDHPRALGWQSDPSRTLGPTDLFQSYAWGAQIYDSPTFYPRPLIGHFANAYGFCGGVWHDAKAGLSFTYGLNGLPLGDEADGLRKAERAIFDAISQLA